VPNWSRVPDDIFMQRRGTVPLGADIETTKDTPRFKAGLRGRITDGLEYPDERWYEASIGDSDGNARLVDLLREEFKVIT